MIDRPFRAELEIARQLAVLASDIALHYFQRGVSADTKPDGTPVTVADIEIEQRLLKELTRIRPEDTVLGAELGVRGFAPPLAVIFRPLRVFMRLFIFLKARAT